MTDDTTTPTSDGSRLLEVGRIVKPHGLRGDVIVSLTTNRHERVAPSSRLQDGSGRAFVVDRSTPHQGRFIVTLEGVNSLDDADALRDTVLFAPPIDDPGTLWVHDLVGAMAVDRGGAELGVVEGVQENPASDLLVLSTGALVPLRFVVDLVAGERVTIDAPDGLFDLP